MECPKCGFEIDKNAMICPNCKKVLRLVCPNCKTINTSNTCKKCGTVIVTKCHKCGKINPTSNKNCKKCNFPLDKSIILNESNTEEFSIITLNFPNLSEIKSILNSPKLFNKFKLNLDKIISDSTEAQNLRRQIIDETYLIRVYKDYTFKATVNSAINLVIDILNKLTALNSKLLKKHETFVKCNIAILKRTTENNPNDFDSGLNISLIQEKDKELSKRVLSAFQIICDNNIFETVSDSYKFIPLNTVEINGQMEMIYELDLKNNITVDETLFKDDEDDEEIKVPNFVQNMLVEQDKTDGEALAKAERPIDPDAVYDMESINFDEIKCEFIRTENIDVFFHMIDKLQSTPMGILALKSDKIHAPYSIKVIHEIEQLKIYNNIITITCYDEMKYSPYSFFRDLVSAIFEYTISQKLLDKNDFIAFKSIDPDNMIKNLIALKDCNNNNASDTRNDYYNIFLTLLQIIPNTLIYIEDFEKIDSSSYDVLKFLFENFDKLKVSYLISYSKDFSLHKDLHSLLSKPYYTEITLKPTAFEKIVADNKEFYKNILHDFYFQRIAKYACGSILFLDVAIQYLLESGVYGYTNSGIKMIESKTIIIPSNLTKLMKRRLNLLKDDLPAIKLLTSMVLLGTRIDIDTINALGYENTQDILTKLSDMGYIYYYNNCVYFPNYNILKESLLDVVNKLDLQKIADELFSKVFDENMPSPIKPFLYTLLNDNAKAFLEWEKLSSINLRLGDFASYLNCADEILKLLDKPEFSNESNVDIKDYKQNLYSNIAQNLYDYVPERVEHIAQTTLKNIENTTDIDNLIEYCNKLINGALLSSKYTYALELTHKILSLIPNASLNPESPNFNIYFLLVSLIHVEILFNIGDMENCIEIGYRVLNVIDTQKLEQIKPNYISETHFKEMITNCVAYIALANVCQLKGNVHEFLNVVYSSMDFIPKDFDIFVQLQNLLFEQNAQLGSYNENGSDYYKIFYNIINAFVNYKEDNKQFAETIYQAKLLAHKISQKQIEVFCDLLIGYSYIQFELHAKANSILYKIIKSVKDMGMHMLEMIGWYLLSELNIRQNKFEVAFGILKNTITQFDKMDKNSDYLLLLLKYNMFKVMMYIKDLPKAEICLNQSMYITQKYEINFKFETNPQFYGITVDTEEEILPEEEIIENEIDNITE